MSRTPLTDALLRNGKGPVLPMHMPGHKRNPALWSSPELAALLPFDITEIEGFDNLQAPQGLLRELNGRLSALWGSRDSFALVNGSTVGILAGLHALVSPGDTVLAARNCHLSVLNALTLLAAKPVWLEPARNEQGLYGPLCPDLVREALQTHPEARVLVLTSPTYEGVVSPLPDLVKLCRSFGVRVFVDEAHGAHLRFLSDPVPDAMSAGTDLAVQSLHKTLPSPTQTAVLHVGEAGPDSARVAASLKIFQTSSPSYVLLAGIEQCASFLEEAGKKAFRNYGMSLKDFRAFAKKLSRLRLLSPESIKLFFKNSCYYDESKLFLSSVTDLYCGPRLAARLRALGVEPEMVTPFGVLLMTSVADRQTTFSGLKTILQVLDREEESLPVPPCRPGCAAPARILPPSPLTPYEAGKKLGGPGTKKDPLDPASRDDVALEALYAYPPDIPLLMPGEKCGTLDGPGAALLSAYLDPALGGTLLTSSGPFDGKLPVCGPVPTGTVPSF